MRRWIPPTVVALALGGLALTARAWAPSFLAFISTNSEMIQGLASAVRLVLWGAAAVIALVAAAVGLKRRRVEGLTESGIGYDRVTIVVADPRTLWQAISRKPPAHEIERATQAFLDYAVDKYQCLDFKGMGIADRVPLRLALVDMYVPLKPRIELPEGETWARELRVAGRRLPPDEASAMGRRLSRPRPVANLLRQHAGVVVLGDPGAGKTTFLKYLALRFATGAGEEFGVGARLPVLVPLSAYANALEERNVPLNAFIVTHFRDRGIRLPVGDMLDKALSEGGALLLLDGLDEVKDQGRRRVVVDRVTDFFALQRRAGNKFLITSRIVGYREVRPAVEGLVECTLVDFEDGAVAEFVAKWTAALERAARGHTAVAREEAKRERAELIDAINRNPSVRGLAANPLLLTILALMKRQGVALPDRRVELYQNYVEALLKPWNLARGLDRPTSPDLDVKETLKVLAPLALWMDRTSPGVGLVRREALRRTLEEIYRGRGHADPERATAHLLSDVRGHAGLLLERGPGEYGFIHLTFQEYLAAVGVAQLGQQDVTPIVRLLADQIGDDAWHEVNLLTVGCLGIIQQRDEAASAVLEELMKRAPGEPGQAIALAGEAVADASPGGVTPACREAVVASLKATMRDAPRVQAPTRARAGTQLSRLGDPRFRPDAWCLPKDPSLLGFGEIPGGRLSMGSDAGRDRDVFRDESPEHPLTLPTYYIARYPVTVAQWAAYVAATGREPRHADSLRGPANHPVVGGNLVRGSGVLPVAHGHPPGLAPHPGAPGAPPARGPRGRPPL